MISRSLPVVDNWIDEDESMETKFVFFIFQFKIFINVLGGGPRVVVSTAAFHEFGVRFPVSAV